MKLQEMRHQRIKIELEERIPGQSRQTERLRAAVFKEYTLGETIPAAIRSVLTPWTVNDFLSLDED